MEIRLAGVERMEVSGIRYRIYAGWTCGISFSKNATDNSMVIAIKSDVPSAKVQSTHLHSLNK